MSGILKLDCGILALLEATQIHSVMSVNVDGRFQESCHALCQSYNGYKCGKEGRDRHGLRNESSLGTLSSALFARFGRRESC